MRREPSPLVWLAIQVDVLGYGLYALIFALEAIAIFLLYS